jgi:hypothetical protein
MNLIEFLRTAKIEDLGLPAQILQKLRDQNLTEFQKVYASIQSYRAFGKCSIEGMTDEEMQVLNQKYIDLMVANRLMKPKNPPVPATTKTNSSTTKTARPAASGPRQMSESKQPGVEETARLVKRYVPDENPPASLSSPLTTWENRLAPQLRKVELVGEIPVSKEELDDISLHFSRLFYNHSTDEVLNFIGRNYPATFLVFIVGQGIFGYNNGDFWSAYEQVLHYPVDSIAFGRLFEKLIQRFGKPQFRDLVERARRYVDPILAHGGIPVYCLKDFFSNIVLNCAIRPQLFALEGEELVEEVIKHTTYTANTDKPVLNFLEYGGPTAANLLDRARNMLLAWQQNQTLLSAEDGGLPVHITQYFAEWTRENAAISLERGSRNRLKRPLLSLDPWGLGIFLNLPSQAVSALNMSDLYWKVEAGDYHEEIKARTQRKGDQLETREITLRLNEVSDNIRVQFSQDGNDFEWKISGYSPDHLILAFDPVTGHIQNHIQARETWLLYPRHLSLSVQKGEGSLLEILPDLPGEWSKLKLECWDLTQANCISLVQNGEVFREIYVRGQEKIEQPSLEGGKIVLTDLEENPIPLYSGEPPKLRIPMRESEDILSELSRWQIKLDSVGSADPDVSAQITLAELSNTDFVITDNIALIKLSASKFLTAKPAGTYQIAIKGPLGKDATLTMQILPECEVSGLKELYIPDRSHGPEPISFSIQTSLLAGVDSLNGADGIKIETEKSGLHHVLVPPEISSVGLLVRREMINHQFVQVPMYLRIKRIRWRMVGDHGLVENWQQKHTTLSLQELLQEESPLLIVDLSGNDQEALNLELNLLDIQGNILQQLKPADRSIKHKARFWRFDLSKIKHSMEINDSPIFRLDLVGVKDAIAEAEFNLPVLVFTRQIQIMQLQTEVYSSADQHHLLVTWEEKKQLRSRALILWSLFRPWQPPIVENIPDSVCGEYEFSISRSDHAEGMYRTQMVVVDPWAPSPPSPLPPSQDTAECHDFEISSSCERLKKLEKEIKGSTNLQTTQFSNRIEISLIRQYLGEMEASNHDLEVCCRNLLPATSREILTLWSILAQTNSTNLEKEFGEQIIVPEVISRLYEDTIAGEITLLEFTSFLALAPHSKYWSVRTCEILLQLEDPKIRFRALDQLVAKDIAKAVNWIVKLIQQSKLSLEDAVEILYEEKPAATEQLRLNRTDSIAEELLDLLSLYNPFSGLPVVRIGSWVFTNAGWGRIEEILDPRTRISVDRFLEGEGKYILSVSLHIYESYGLTGEKALINMATNEIIFPRANRIFICQHCQEFTTANLEIFKNHLLTIHGNALPYPGEHRNMIQLTSIQFNMNPKRNNGN